MTNIYVSFSRIKGAVLQLQYECVNILTQPVVPPVLNFTGLHFTSCSTFRTLIGDHINWGSNLVQFVIHPMGVLTLPVF